jgi:hypothetical protein
MPAAEQPQGKRELLVSKTWLQVVGLDTIVGIYLWADLRAAPSGFPWAEGQRSGPAPAAPQHPAAQWPSANFASSESIPHGSFARFRHGRDLSRPANRKRGMRVSRLASVAALVLSTALISCSSRAGGDGAEGARFESEQAERAFNLLVAIGKSAAAKIRHTAKQALGSLRIEYCDPPLPTATHPTCQRPVPH